MTDREACLIFNMISGIGYAKFKALCAAFDTPSEALAQSEQALLRVPGIGPQLAERVANWKRDVDFDGEMRMAERGGVRVLSLFDEAYPAILRELHDPPLVLYVRGVLPEFGQGNALGVVGSRRMSRYGEEMTAMLTAEAVDAGFSIISGLALGVDTVAHRTAVDKQGITVAVLGGGLARLHPQENLPLARAIIETGGAVITEFPMKFPVSRTSFPRRNRIVARLSDGVLVTEAGLDSGALITANLAVEYHGNVMAVPGRVDNPQARGCNKLIKNGHAALVEEIGDVVALMRGDLFSLTGEMDVPEVEYVPGSTADLPEEENRILVLLRERELSFDDLCSATGQNAAELTTSLMVLEMKMLIRHDARQNYSLR